jgi:hypothetical protein
LGFGGGEDILVKKMLSSLLKEHQAKQAAKKDEQGNF